MARLASGELGNSTKQQDSYHDNRYGKANNQFLL